MERDQATRFVHDLLRLLLTKEGSDLFLTAEFPPAFKVDGRVLPVSNQPLTGQHTSELVRAIMNDRQAAEFEATKECNFAINPTGIGRFRVNRRSCSRARSASCSASSPIASRRSTSSTCRR